MQLWGVLNVTPDSFSDGGRFIDPAAAIAHARRLRLQGASVIDVGGESTRPGATPIGEDEEQRRILPVITELVAEGFTISVDTIHASTARLALDAGAQIVNDVTAGQHDPAMLSTVAAAGARIVLMHSRGIDPTADTHYDDVASEVVAFLTERIAAATAAGIDRSQIILDPGFGFSKDAATNWRLFDRLGDIVALGFPVVIGTSRKRFIGAALPYDQSPEDRDVATAATTLLASQRGVWAARVHDVRSSADVLATLDAASAVRAPTQPLTVRLTGVRATGFHGVLAHERAEGQEFVVDVTLSLDGGAAIATDDVHATVHYGEVAEQIVRVIEGDPVDLIETLADRIADAVLAFARVESADVVVHKPQAPITVAFGDVSVSISKGVR